MEVDSAALVSSRASYGVTLKRIEEGKVPSERAIEPSAAFASSKPNSAAYHRLAERRANWHNLNLCNLQTISWLIWGAPIHSMGVCISMERPSTSATAVAEGVCSPGGDFAAMEALPL